MCLLRDISFPKLFLGLWWIGHRLQSFTVSQRRWLHLSCCVLSASVLFAACAGSGGGTTQSSGATNVPLSQLRWCGKPLMIFRDEAASIPTVAATAQATPSGTATAAPGNATTITNWARVKPKLGFTVFLPAMLASGTCLMSASGTLHDPIFGSSFTIGYLLPDHSALSFSEAPLRSKNIAFQCGVSVNPTAGSPKTGKPTAASSPVQLCSGALDTTNIVFSARGMPNDLKAFFQALQPNVDWIPS